MVVKKFVCYLVLSVMCVVCVLMFGMVFVVDFDFFGKIVEWVILFFEMGGLVKWVNFYVLLLSEVFLGNLIVVVKFMLGVGFIKGVNWFQGQEYVYSEGIVIFGFFGLMQFFYLFGDFCVCYEYKDWNVVLVFGMGGVVYLLFDFVGKMNGNDVSVLCDIDFIYGF